MRIRILQFFFAGFFILLILCLFYLQIVEGSVYRDLSYRNSIRLLNVVAPRGIIYDSHNKILAHDKLSFGVFIVPQEVDYVDERINQLSETLGVSYSLLTRNYKRNYRAPFAPVQVIDDISKNDAIFIESMKPDLPGVLVREMAKRNYPYKEALSHIVGYIGEIDKRELARLKSYGYGMKDLIGKDGIERAADSYLRGKDGGMQIQVDNRGRQVRVLSSKQAKRGKDVYLTIDGEFQNFVWRMMEGRKGAAVFMDPRNGEILALVSSPSYDANASLAPALNEPDAPLMNRAIAGQYPPGSIFKIVVSLAGLESGRLKLDKTFFCKGILNIGDGAFHCWNRDGHGLMDLKNALIESCNIYFYNAGMIIGAEEISEYARTFGFGRQTGIDLFGEEKGFVPTKVWKRHEKREPWYAGDTANFSIGQGYLLVTPLQIVRMVACVANGGELVTPHIVKKMEDGPDQLHEPAKLKLKKENLELVRSAMRGVTHEAEGTGFRAWSEYVSISGKTGTSQAGADLDTHAWFVGFAPSEDPEICFVVFLEHGGSGGDLPALIVKKAVEYWYRRAH